ncbi:MAG TPA: hypothetical protein VGB26_03585 [Nitrospiria bacterium]|jgi:hypothetical protein
MKEILNTIIFGGFTAQEVLMVAGVAVVFWIAIRIMVRVFKKKESSQVFQFVDCLNCDWHGKVSRYAGRCPKCNQPLGERKAQHIA